MKRALITGISGQDGAYLAQFLLRKGYVVYGTSRDHQRNPFENLTALGVHDDVNLMSMSSEDIEQVELALNSCRPHEVYNLACQSSVSRSFEFPEETHNSIVVGTRTIMEAVLRLDPAIRFFNPASSEMYGETPTPATEQTPLNPLSPYGEAKAEALKLVTEYRQNEGLFACSAIMFNHESSLRPPTFVTRKIVDGAITISRGEQKKLFLGNLDIIRDWGWAPEYADAMWRMMQLQRAEDVVLATGQSFRLCDFVKMVFDGLDLNWKNHVVTDSSLFRESDIQESRGNPKKASSILNWQTTITTSKLTDRLLKTALSKER